MRLNQGTTILSPTDLSNHLSCPHLTRLDLAAARGELNAPFRNDSQVEALQLRGAAHEEAYLDHLRAGGRTVFELPRSATLEGRICERPDRPVHVQVPRDVDRQGRHVEFHGAG